MACYPIWFRTLPCRWLAISLLPLLLFLYGREPTRLAMGAQGPMLTTPAASSPSRLGVKVSQPSPPATIQDFTKYLFVERGYDNAVVGMLDKTTLLTARYGFKGGSTIDFWDLKTGKVKAQIVSPTPVESNSVEISPDGKRLLAIQNVAVDIEPPVFTPHRAYGWDLQTQHLTINIKNADNRQVCGAFINPTDSKTLLVIDTDDPRTTEGAKITLYDINTGKIKDVIPNKESWVLISGYVVFSPDGKYLVDIDEPTDTEPRGLFRIWDSRTFAVVTTFDGEVEGRTVDKPVFFIDNDKVVLSNTLYNLTTHKASSVLPGHHNMHGKCLAPVPNQPGYALFLIQRANEPRGFELWNIRANTVVYRWPLTRRPTRMIGKPDARQPKSEPVGVTSAFVSRDGLAFGFLDDQGVFRVYDYNFNALPAANGPTAAGGQPKTDHHG